MKRRPKKPGHGLEDGRAPHRRAVCAAVRRVTPITGLALFAACCRTRGERGEIVRKYPQFHVTPARRQGQRINGYLADSGSSQFFGRPLIGGGGAVLPVRSVASPPGR